MSVIVKRSALETALILAKSGGFSVIPIAPDASKSPTCAWAQYQTRIASEFEIQRMFQGECGVAIVAGDASANLEVLDIEAVAPFAEFCELVREHDPALLDILPHVETPSGGHHLFYRCDEIAGNQKLAMKLDPTGRPKVLFETRGRGGYVLTVGSPPACHEDHKEYRLVCNRLTQTPRITPAQRGLLLDCARSFNEIRKEPAKRSPPTNGHRNGNRPGDVLKERATWAEILEPHGWAVAGHRGEETFWRRPGKDFGPSATTNYHGSDLFYNFSTNAHPFEHETSYSKFYVYAQLNHGGDESAAARELAQRFGLPPKNFAVNEIPDARQAEPDEAQREPEAPEETEPTAKEPEPELEPELPSIDVSYQDLVQLTAQTWEAIQRANREPFLFRRGTIVRIEKSDRGSQVIREVTQDRMRHAIAPVARWFRPATQKSPEAPAMPPMSVVRNILATPNPPLPALLRIVEAPVFTRKKTLHITPGYNATSQLYYEPAPGLNVPAVPDQPGDEDIQRARELIFELIGEFPFIGDAERAHAVALFLLPFVRDLIDGPTPLHLIEKPAAGTGATLLAVVLAYPATGRPLDAMTEGRDEDEWRKRITAKIATGPTFLLIDNLRRRLDSAAVSSAISASSWEDRRLGHTEMISFPVTLAWIATGNNPSLSSEMARRTIRIRMDAKTDRPWQRENFKHRDLRAWVSEQRSNLIWSALVLGQNWIRKGCPKHDGKHLGMFESWSDVVGGILATAGIVGFLSNLDDFYESSDAEGSEWRTFILAWRSQWGGTEVTVSNLSPIAENLPLGDGNERSQKTRLGKLLADAKDRQFGQFRVKKGTLLDGLQRWKLEASEGT